MNKISPSQLPGQACAAGALSLGLAMAGAAFGQEKPVGAGPEKL